MLIKWQLSICLIELVSGVHKNVNAGYQTLSLFISLSFLSITSRSPINFRVHQSTISFNKSLSAYQLLISQYAEVRVNPKLPNQFLLPNCIMILTHRNAKHATLQMHNTTTQTWVERRWKKFRKLQNAETKVKIGNTTPEFVKHSRPLRKAKGFSCLMAGNSKHEA